MLTEDEKRIAHLQMEAIHFSFEDKLGSVVQKGIEAAQCMFRNESSEELEFAMTSLHTQLEIVMKWDKNRGDSTRKQVYALCEIIEIMIKDKILSSSLPQNLDNQQSIPDLSAESKSFSKIADSAAIISSDRKLIKERGEYGDRNLMTMPMFAEGIAQNDEAVTVDTTKYIEAITKIEDEDSYFDDNGVTNYGGKQEDNEIPLDTGEALEQMVALELTEYDRSIIDFGDNSQLQAFHAESMDEMIVDEDDGMENIDDDFNFMEESDDSYNPAYESIRRINSTTRRKKNKKRKNKGNTKSGGTYKCDECEKEFKYPYQLTRHKRSAHAATEEARRPFACETCGKRYPSKFECKRHSRMHLTTREVEERPFACDTCGQKFPTRFACTRHIRVHSKTDELRRPFACETCGKRFSTKFLCKRHSQMHLTTREVEERPFACDTCGQKFPTRFACTRHIRVHSTTDEFRRPFACETCGKRFSTKFLCSRHSRAHTIEMPVEKPVANELCDTPIAPNPQLLKYMRKPKSSLKLNVKLTL